MKDNRMDNIVECAYKMDNGYVEVWFTDGNMLRIKCEEVEAALRTTEQSLAKLHKLLDNKPIEYVAMALSGEMQAYCDIEDDMVKGMFGTIVQGYLKKGYNRATAEMMAREFFRYESCRDFALKNKSPCSACEFQAKQGISILGIKLLFFSV